MHTFSYKARTVRGVEQKGKLLAENEAEVMQMLKQDELVVIDIRKLSFIESFDVMALLPVPLNHIEEFYRQLAFLLESGIPLNQALHSVAKPIKHKRLKESLIVVAKGLSEGISFSEGLAKYPKLFPPIVINMIKMAEGNGKYDQTCHNLADYFKRLREMRSKLFGAIGYPAFIFIFAVGVSIFLSTTMVPQIANNLTEAGSELPSLTKLVVGVSNNIFWIVAIVVAIVIGIVIGWIYIKKHPDIKVVVDRRILKLPFIGMVLAEIHESRFCDGMSTLLKGGIPIALAIRTVGNITSNEAMKRVILKAGEDLTQGKKLSATLEESTLFTDSFVLVTNIGEQTGKMDESFYLLAKKYEVQTDIVIKRLIGVITPVMLILLGLMVGVVVVAIFQAMNALYRAY